MRLKHVQLAIVLMIILLTGSRASGQCAPDGNDTSADATPIGLTEIVTGFVCPDDPFDYYTFTIPEGGGYTGTINFDASQIGTVFRIDGDAGTVFEEDSENFVAHLQFAAESGDLSGTYYIRISHWSVYGGDHEYTITMDLNYDDCVPDDNEVPENAVDLAYDEEVKGFVCDVDHLDIYRITVDSVLEGKSTISLTARPGELFMYFYDSEWNELHHGPTVGGILEYQVNADGPPLADGDYYIGVFLPLHRTDENSYMLKVTPAELTIVTSVMLKAFDDEEDEEDSPLMSSRAFAKVAPKFKTGLKPVEELAPVQMTEPVEYLSPWPHANGNTDNNCRSRFGGKYGSFSFTTFSGNTRRLPFSGNGRYVGLMTGPNGWIYCFDQISKKLYAYDYPDYENAWSVVTGSSRPPCLGNDGRIYYIHEDGNRLIRAGGTNNAITVSKNLPHAGYRAVELVGSRVYASTTFHGNETSYLYCYSKDGDLIWTSDALEGRMRGVIEDVKNGYIYVQTGERLYQLDWAGRENWHRVFLVNLLGGMFTYFPPMLGPDGGVWSYHPDQQVWTVHDEDGNIIAAGGFDSETKPRSVCMSSDGLFYIASKGRLACYENWDELVWEDELTWRDDSDPVGEKYWIGDIILDRYDNMFMWMFKEHYVSGETEYSSYWKRYSPSAGGFYSASFFPNAFIGAEIESVIDNQFLSGGGELAFSDNGNLVCLSIHGFLTVF